MQEDHRKKFTDANKQKWDASAHLHQQGEAWEKLCKDAGQDGFSVFDDCMTQCLQDVGISGRRAVQFGCNNGRELLSLASFGAIPCLGIDQSAKFLTQAAMLAEAAGLAPRFLEADIYDLPKDVGTFDLALITIGVLGWMPDLPAFFKVVAGLMVQDAKLVMYETHPFLEMFQPDHKKPYEPQYSYFDREAFALEEAITYDGSDGGTTDVGYWFTHTMGAIVNAAIQAGLRIERLDEYAHSNREVEFDIYQNRTAQMPMSFTLVATR